MKKHIKLGLIGAGVVGSNTVKLLLSNSSLIRNRMGIGIDFLYICDKDRKKLDALKKYAGNAVFTSDWRRVTGDKNVDIVVELTGIKELARDIVISALKNNKYIVTANKALLAEKWDEIFTLARDRKRLIYFEASVASAVPVIQGLNEGLAANRISSINGILNGTCNYILTRMLHEKVNFSLALADAQARGFAEPNPQMDIDGKDTLYKLAILSSIAWGCEIDLKQIYQEGISNLSLDDVMFAYNEFGYTVKLIGMAKKEGNRLELQVRPCLISGKHPFAPIEDEYNSIVIDGDACGPIIMSGKGAGGGPAASAVVSDIMFLSKEIAAGIAGELPYVVYDKHTKLSYSGIDSSEGNFYLRFATMDKPGVLSKISGILGKYNVSIASVFQRESLSSHRNGVSILMLTHKAVEGNLRKAIEEINSLNIIKGKTVLLKIIEW